jgi:hypothetical protein
MLLQWFLQNEYPGKHLGRLETSLTVGAEIVFLTQYAAQDSTIFGESIQKRLR